MVQVLAVGFYEDVLVELMAAIGAALFFGNAFALVRRRQDRLAAMAVPGGPATDAASTADPVVDGDDELGDGDLPEAPVIRTVAFAALGFVVMVWGLASVFS
jgi:hypothetical protein